MKRLAEWLEPKLSIALLVTLFAFIGITALSITIIAVSADGKVLESATLVFNSVLPLFATWVGTILAYYYARENLQASSTSLEATTRSAVELASIRATESLRSKPITVAMIPKDKMLYADKLTDKLSEWQKKLGDAGFRFLPVLSSDGKPLALTDRERILAFMTADHSSQPDLKDLKAEDLTLGQLLKSEEYSRPFACVPRNASLADAKDAINKTAECRVAFVTEKGTKEELVVGMLTETDIMKFAEV